MVAVLTADELDALRDEVGSVPADDVLQAKHQRIGLGWRDVAVAVLKRRLIDMLANPASFSVAGEYGQSTGANIAALERKIKLLEADAAAANGTGDGSTGVLERCDSAWSR